MSSPLDVTGARDAFAEYLMTTPYTIARTYPTATTLTGLCAFGPQSGKLEQGGAQVQERGQYLMQVVVDADISPTDRPVIQGRTFRIVWSPPANELSLSRQFGLMEVR